MSSRTWARGHGRRVEAMPLGAIQLPARAAWRPGGALSRLEAAHPSLRSVACLPPQSSLAVVTHDMGTSRSILLIGCVRVLPLLPVYRADRSYELVVYAQPKEG